MTSVAKIATGPLGKNGPIVPRIGLGLMGLSGVYGLPASDEERLAFLDEVYKRGETFWDTADEYGDNEELIAKWFKANPEKRQDIFLATKFAVRIAKGADAGPRSYRVDSTPEYAREAIEKSLKRLNLPYVDLYYCHRLDKVTPIEKTVEAMVELKNAGKIKHLGLSECSAESLRRAYAVHPIVAVQVEYSPFCLAIESPQIKLLEVARELGVAVVCYSPIGNGLLSGTIRTREDFTGPGDLRAALPWLKEENLQKNLDIVDEFSKIAAGKDVTPAQLSLAWLLSQGDDIFPIPGTTKIHRLEENLKGLSIHLSPDEEKAVRDLSTAVLGDRVQNANGYAFADTPPLY